MTNIRSSLLKRFNALRHSRIALIKHENSLFLVDRANRLDEKMMGGLDWERALRDRAVKEIKEHKLDLFLDVGANLGLYTIDLQRRVSPLETLAFEPQPDSYNQLCGNIFANGLSDLVRAERIALSDRSGEAVMQVDSDSNIHSGLGDADLYDKRKFDREIRVPLARFDDLYTFENRRIFLKMDIEGHELQALAGMRNLLTRNKASLQIECSDPRIDQLRELMTEFGYRATGELVYDRFFSNL
ncbi:FkbM family methyltransferase [Parvibaculum sp.]|uniref:FkbM family methyltransferase n=1 Tax=Parvibaculum sp. TaxID=2024848 RepID=UPI001E08B420|nr:FkbM family methyltransferase [Parvibaculum sp.]MBX3488936.1 FkbM family methyltransferase [Parvibaculum sp.]MCW5727181.1 FkbM family methyltransferase [Parvibaculum sp.]